MASERSSPRARSPGRVGGVSAPSRGPRRGRVARRRASPDQRIAASERASSTSEATRPRSVTGNSHRGVAGERPNAARATTKRPASPPRRSNQIPARALPRPPTVWRTASLRARSPMRPPGRRFQKVERSTRERLAGVLGGVAPQARRSSRQRAVKKKIERVDHARECAAESGGSEPRWASTREASTRRASHTMGTSTSAARSAGRARRRVGPMIGSARRSSRTAPRRRASGCGRTRRASARAACSG